MRVTMLRTPAAHYGCPLGEGETGKVDDSLGDLLVSQQLAIAIDEPLRAVPERPAIAKAAEPEIKPEAKPRPETKQPAPVRRKKDDDK